MTDYSKMSDFEINSAVARSFGLADFLFFKVDEEICSGPVWEVGSGNTYNGVRCSKGNPFDPCNNPADAWPIIEENKISTMWMTSEKEWCAWAEGDLAEGTWDWENVPDYYFNCTSQLRAAMIVFLMMKDAENAPAI